jgi:hypothetical protein
MIPKRALPVVVIAMLLAGSQTSAESAKHTEALLPDLAQDPPSQISVQQVAAPNGLQFRLGFRSAVSNVGKGPLIVTGSRPDARSPMRADQLVKLSNGALRTYRDILRMRYVYTPTHNHFHVLHFDRYSLRTLSGRRVRPDQKTGFCLGDREEASLARLNPAPYYGPLTGECDRGHPEALRVLEGLTPGWLDDYGPQLEGQYIDITGLPAGQYSLVHQANADGRIREHDRHNDVASALIRVRWPNGPGQSPVVGMIRTCVGRATCRVPKARGSVAPTRVPVLTAAETARFRLSCSVVHPAAPLTPAAARARRARISDSGRAWREAMRRFRR